MKRTLTLILLYLMTSQFSFTQNDIWQTAIYAEDDWKYISGSASIPNNWRELVFDDNAWQVGEGGIGYGDNDDATEIAPVFSLYMRKSFALSDKDKILGGLFNADFDDAFVAYLNGVEIARANISGQFPGWNQDAIDYREAIIFNGGDALNYFIDPDLLDDILQNGENVLAVQTHNKDGLTSSDLTSLYWLSFVVSETLDELGDFHIEGLQSGIMTPLPIVKINTGGVVIPNEPKIDAQLGITWNGEGNLNDFSAFANEYSGPIKIEKRGQTSQFLFPKNSYAVEMVDDEGNDIDTSFLDFPSEEDFVIHGPYSDKTLMRNVLTFELANKIGQYASRTKFIELEVNGNYEGIYVMMERIKRDKNRVDIAKLKAEDISGDELTGGYIFKIDKDQPDWYSSFDIEQNPGAKLHFQYVYPRREDIMPEQAQYIQSYVDSFERALISPLAPPDGKFYHEFIDIESFVDHFLLVEFAKDVDGYRFSTYMHKDKDSNGGKLKCGPLWDFNLSFGNANYCNGWQAFGWMYYLQCDVGNPFWWDDLFRDDLFANHAKCRWGELRETVLHKDSLYNMIDEHRAILEPALDRNYDRWPVMGQYVWPNYNIAGNYNGEINLLKQFIGDRLEWMDSNMFGFCDSTAVINPGDAFEFTLAPNPTAGNLNLRFAYPVEGDFRILIYNELGREVSSLNPLYQDNHIVLDVSHLPKGIYFVSVGDEGSDAILKKFVLVE